MPFHKKPKYPWVYANYYDDLLFYDGRDAWYSRYLRCPENGRNLFCVHWTYLEIANGGFWQFFFNSTGVIAPEAVIGYKAIGMPEAAELIAGAMKLLPDPYPFDKEDRMRIVGPPSNRMDFNQFDEPFYALTVPPKLFFSKPRYYEHADNYAQRTGGLDGVKH